MSDLHYTYQPPMRLVRPVSSSPYSASVVPERVVPWEHGPLQEEMDRILTREAIAAHLEADAPVLTWAMPLWRWIRLYVFACHPRWGFSLGAMGSGATSPYVEGPLPETLGLLIQQDPLAFMGLAPDPDAPPLSTIAHFCLVPQWLITLWEDLDNYSAADAAARIRDAA